MSICWRNQSRFQEWAQSGMGAGSEEEFVHDAFTLQMAGKLCKQAVGLA